MTGRDYATRAWGTKCRSSAWHGPGTGGGHGSGWTGDEQPADPSGDCLRPVRGAGRQSAGRRRSARRRQPRHVIGLVVCASLALTGWFLADAGAHGDTLDAVGVGADVWLAGHGPGSSCRACPSVSPPLVGHHGRRPHGIPGRSMGRARCRGRRRRDPRRCRSPRSPAPTSWSRSSRASLASRPGADPGLGRAVLGALLVGAVAGGAGLAAGCGRLAAWFARVPHWACGHRGRRRDRRAVRSSPRVPRWRAARCCCRSTRPPP